MTAPSADFASETLPHELALDISVGTTRNPRLSLGQVALAMTAFGTGAALPLLLLGLLSREAMAAWRGRLLHAGKAGKTVLGGLLVVLGLLIFSGLDKPIETFLVNASPIWLTELTTRF